MALNSQCVFGDLYKGLFIIKYIWTKNLDFNQKIPSPSLYFYAMNKMIFQTLTIYYFTI